MRGHDGYGFPKWVTELDVQIDAGRTTARVANDSGGTDIALSTPTPRQQRSPSGKRVSSLTSYTWTKDAWHSVLNQLNVLSGGSALMPRDLELTLGTGRMSDDVRSLKPIKTVRLDVVTEGQIALHMPVPTSVPTTA
ncbi:hypothetical protein FNL39_1087 [Nocardia caishijiensis]|uniref:Uncharacterized protein n=1 Tax=Nocardia caishijiensis TaxID=184756 RepID=A0ABQ6YHF2_9NOCA|nr:hypothetical protein FNL39_1087 [Nocardia caishijiensis]